MNKLTKQTRQILKSSDGKTSVRTVQKTGAGCLIKQDPTKTVKVISLGGLYEIGKNTWCFECGNEIMLIDAGIAFPTVDMIGVDIVLPKLNYIVENRDKIRGMIVTHGHEDHIGGIVPLLKEVNVPIIYGPKFALALLKAKLKDGDLPDQKIKQVEPRETVKVGQSFAVTYIRNNHSIADSFSLIIDTPAGRIVHSGDFKFDHSPVDNEYFDIAALARAGEEGVTLLLSDSTNAEKASYTPSEKVVIPKLKEYITKGKRKVFVTTFASQVARIKLIMQIAIGAGKKIVVLGRSMVNLAVISKELGYINIPDNSIIKPEDVAKVPPEDVLVLSTGSQGEQFAALSRIARGEHKHVKVEPGDTVVMSASPIPGNEKSVNNLIDNLFKRGADVIYGAGHSVHVSGHASQEEQKLMLSLAQPKYFMPCHGEYRMLVRHGQTGVQCGVDADNVFLMDNGDVLEIKDGECQVTDRVEAGIVMVDNANVGELDNAIMLERRMLAEEGLLSIVATVNSESELLADPKVYSKGLIMESGDARNEFLKRVIEITREAIADSNHKNDVLKLETDVKSEIHKYVDDKLHKHPLLEVVIMQSAPTASARVVGI